MLKILVGAACVAVLAYAGYFFWGEYRAYEANRQAQQAAVDQQQREALAAAGRCKALRDQMMAEVGDGTHLFNYDGRAALRACIAAGSISAAEVSALGL